MGLFYLLDMCRIKRYNIKEGSDYMKIHFSIRFEEEVKALLKKLAKEHNRSMTQEMEYLIKKEGEKSK